MFLSISALSSEDIPDSVEITLLLLFPLLRSAIGDGVNSSKLSNSVVATMSLYVSRVLPVAVESPGNQLGKLIFKVSIRS